MRKMKQEQKNAHHSHQKVNLRLKRASGHLQKVISMIEHEEPCLAISQQLHAVVKALIEAKKEIIHDHIEHCLDEKNLRPKDIQEFKEIAKYL